MQRIAIVTGASSGVGREFVRQLDSGRGGPLDEIWLVARSANTLEEVADSCNNVRAVSLPCDLCKDDAISGIASMLDERDVVVEWLVNSAGFGKFGDFQTIDAHDSAQMVRLNCLAVVSMCSAVLPHMHAGSRIINMSSIAGAIPQVMLATYSATKAFVLELSRLLNHELHSTGIRVVAVCPKFMRTNFLDNPGNAHAAEGMCRIGFEDVDKVVSMALARAILGKPLCIPNRTMRLAYMGSRIIPRRALFCLEDLLFRR